MEEEASKVRFSLGFNFQKISLYIFFTHSFVITIVKFNKGNCEGGKMFMKPWKSLIKFPFIFIINSFSELINEIFLMKKTHQYLLIHEETLKNNIEDFLT